MNHLYQHFRKEEQSFVDQVTDWLNQVDYQYTPYLTSFLNPREQFIVEAIVGQSDAISVSFFGGITGTERQRALIKPSYIEDVEGHYDIALCEISYPEKFSQLSHRDILGAILGTGIDRKKLGDIIQDDGRWQLFVDAPLVSFLTLHVTTVGRTTVSLIEKPLKEAVPINEHWQKKNIVISSRRLDVFIAGGLRISRDQAKQLIVSGKVKLNWTSTENVSEDVNEKDIISVRGFGRLTLLSIDYRTRKDKLAVEIGTLLQK
ncbi:RNA-binding protein [Dolosigranulum pigrum]|jgi:RNA-binding protein|uniref:YlmH family RNA-binding protein n=1 Tax=Dolosigranulum pigrum TaxID=29394 RepID=UPI001AD86939|nr:YlmH/Sll1252 family protein [Dolosigranulum pigrum]QTJ54950.1 RNA-binding protein [Dolosigranulum pigrum]